VLASADLSFRPVAVVRVNVKNQGPLAKSVCSVQGVNRKVVMAKADAARRAACVAGVVARGPRKHKCQSGTNRQQTKSLHFGSDYG